MIRIVLSVAALLSPFLFPYPATLLLSIAASLLFPPIGLLAGLLTDLAYFVPAASVLPVATVTGLAISVISVFVRRFFKARIIGG